MSLEVIIGLTTQSETRAFLKMPFELLYNCASRINNCPSQPNRLVLDYFDAKSDTIFRQGSRNSKNYVKLRIDLNDFIIKMEKTMELVLEYSKAAAGFRNTEALVEEAVKKLNLPWSYDQDVYEAVTDREKRSLVVRYITLMGKCDNDYRQWATKLCR
jgi:hypothetical protein